MYNLHTGSFFTPHLGQHRLNCALFSNATFFFLIMKFFALSTIVYFALHPLQFLIRHRLLHWCAMPGATRSIFCCNSQYRTISANVQCAIASVYNDRWYQTCFCNSLCRTMSARLKCTIATAYNAGCYQIINTYYLDTINASSPFLRSDREGVWKELDAEKIFYHYSTIGTS